MTEEEIMLTHLLKCNRTELLVEKPNLTKDQMAQLEEMKQRRLSNEPLQYILKETDFMGRIFKVDERVLIPRPETEIMVEMAIVKAKLMLKNKEDVVSLRILDLGTGSGNIAITLAKEIDECRVITVDISRQALEMAQENAKAHGVVEKVDFVCADMVDFLNNQIAGNVTFDLIVSNPPYIETNQIPSLQKEVQFEPRVALDGGKRGLDYCLEIIAKSEDVLKKNGVLLMEIGDGQRPSIESFFEQIATSQEISFEKDYRQTDRIVVIES